MVGLSVENTGWFVDNLFCFQRQVASRQILKTREFVTTGVYVVERETSSNAVDKRERVETHMDH